ncbi:hypothetical protein [Bartonella harrusi]|uniref:Uncharacterized protein n=1 Tax=Bartonella harrusi TaxID=2961895 RepID=A0ABY5ET97_9HYPH|nr:hypothetical protein [Bartonella harrusi]UTO28086.1 hypothetical protein NMK50_07735 [Bartonella harrusi]
MPIQRKVWLLLMPVTTEAVVIEKPKKEIHGLLCLVVEWAEWILNPVIKGNRT